MAQDPNEHPVPGCRSVTYDDPAKVGNVKCIAIIQVGIMDTAGFFNLGPQNQEISAKIDP